MTVKTKMLEDKLETVLDDNANHPVHYTYGSIEVIDVIEGRGLPYHLGNAVKYMIHPNKDPFWKKRLLNTVVEGILNCNI